MHDYDTLVAAREELRMFLEYYSQSPQCDQITQAALFVAEQVLGRAVSDALIRKATESTRQEGDTA